MGLPPALPGAIQSVIDAQLTVERPTLYDISGTLAVAKLALVVLRQLPALLAYTVGKPEPFKVVQPIDLLFSPHASSIAPRLEVVVANDPVAVRLALKSTVDL